MRRCWATACCRAARRSLAYGSARLQRVPSTMRACKPLRTRHTGGALEAGRLAKPGLARASRFSCPMRRLFVTSGENLNKFSAERVRKRISAPSSLKANEAVRKWRSWLRRVCAIPYSTANLSKRCVTAWIATAAESSLRATQHGPTHYRRQSGSIKVKCGRAAAAVTAAAQQRLFAGTNPLFTAATMILDRNKYCVCCMRISQCIGWERLHN